MQPNGWWDPQWNGVHVEPAADAPVVGLVIPVTVTAAWGAVRAPIALFELPLPSPADTGRASLAGDARWSILFKAIAYLSGRRSLIVSTACGATWHVDAPDTLPGRTAAP